MTFMFLQAKAKFGLRTGDTVERNKISKRWRKYLLPKIESINFEKPDNIKQRINFDNLTPYIQ